jgi:glycosyltransferase involved in cell wall biosynthesis
MAWLAKLFENHIVAKSDYSIVVTEVIKKYIQDLGMPEDRITIQPIAVDSGLFSPESTRPPKHMVEKCRDKIVIGYVGTLLHYHRIDHLMNIAKTLRSSNHKVLFLMIGGGAQKVDKYARMAKQEGVEHLFHFVGSVNYREIPSYLHLVDIGIIPHTAPWAAPTKMFEYASMGKPIIAPDYPGVRNFIPDIGRDLLFAPDDIEQMTQKIINLVNDEPLRKQLGEMSRKRVLSGYSWQHYIDKIEKIALSALQK